MKKRKKSAENKKDVEVSKEYSIKELIKLGEEHNKIHLAKPLYEMKKK